MTPIRARFLIGAAALAACAPALHVSAPADFPPGMTGEVDAAGRATLRLDDLEVRIEVRNPRTSGVAWEMPIYTFPWIVPLPYPASWDAEGVRGDLVALALVAAVEGFTFDPTAVVVAPEGGSPFGPADFVGPGQGALACEGRAAGLPARKAAERFPIPPGPAGVCFVLRFPREVPPKRPFVLSLRRVSRAGRPVAVPDLRFEPRQVEGEPRRDRPEAFER